MKLIISIFLILAAQAAHAGANMQISGTFDVKLTPQTSADTTSWARMRIEKTFHGQLDGGSAGEMLAVRTETKGSAGYVALEKVSATLDGRKGTFFLQHSGLMDRGSAALTVSVVPDSANGELTGLKGTMTIDIINGQHHYGFSYSLP
jgi:hypothetical protein